MFVRLWGFGADYTLSNAAAVYFVLLYRVRRHPDPSQKRFAFELGSEEVGLKRATWEREKLMEEIPALYFHILFTAYEPQCWWFEIVETLRRLILKGGLLFVNPTKSELQHRLC